MIVFVHTNFGLVQIQGSEVKRGGESAPPRSERVFEIPVRVGLSNTDIAILLAKMSSPSILTLKSLSFSSRCSTGGGCFPPPL